MQKPTFQDEEQKLQHFATLFTYDPTTGEFTPNKKSCYVKELAGYKQLQIYVLLVVLDYKLLDFGYYNSYHELEE